MLLNDRQIQARQSVSPIFTPYAPEKLNTVETQAGDFISAISYGQSHAGYDLRLSPLQFDIFHHVPGQVVDPKSFNPEFLYSAPLAEDEGGEFFILPGNTYALGVTIERIKIPEDVAMIFIGKSTYARAGIIANLTPGEPGWEGHLTLEITNASRSDCRIYANEGIVQALLFEVDKPDHVYRGKYQNQSQRVTYPRI